MAAHEPFVAGIAGYAEQTAGFREGLGVFDRNGDENRVLLHDSQPVPRHRANRSVILMAEL